MAHSKTSALMARGAQFLGSEYAILCGAMSWVSERKLVSAISNAGGFGVIACGAMTPELLDAEIAATKLLTDKPFGVNLTILPSVSPPPYAEYRQAIIDSGIRIVETAGYKPQEHVDHFKSHGIIVLHKCTAVRHAVSSVKMGVDVISIDGFECAGHPGEDDIPGLILIPAAADQVKVPMLASGGIGDGRGLAAALALGAEGVNMGTRFCATKEAPIHDDIKQLMVENDERDTNLIFRKFRNTGRVAKTRVSDEVVAIEGRDGTEFKDVQPLVSGAKGRVALETGDRDAGLIWAGMIQGLIHDIPSCADLIARIVDDAEEIINGRLARMVG